MCLNSLRKIIHLIEKTIHYIKKEKEKVIEKNDESIGIGYLDESGEFIYHSFDDEPAIIWNDGTKFWYKDGKKHRDNHKPAIIYSDGVKYWYKDDEIHRDNHKPAIIYSDGDCGYYKNGNRYWFINGTEYHSYEEVEEVITKGIELSFK